MNENKPLISVVVTIYNAAPFLRRALESLVYQTLEDIEIICVDKASEDNSLEILNEYQNAFPNKVKVFSIPFSDTPADGRNYGIKKSSAEYIAFLDADDMLEFNALEKLYKETLKNDYDIIWYQFYLVSSFGKRISNKLNFPLDKGELIRNADIAFWNKLFKKSVLQDFGPIPEDTIFDDTSYIIPIISKIKKQGYVACPLYHHIERNDSESKLTQSPRMIHAIYAAKNVIENVNPVYLNDAVYRMTKWMIFSAQNRWIFLDEYIDFLKENNDLILENPYLKKDLPALKRVSQYISLPDNKIPPVVYLNGFDSDLTEAQIVEVSNKAFNKHSKVIVLNQDNCNIHENNIVETAALSGNTEFLAEYFALKNIYESGGVYIGKHIRIDAPLSALSRNNAFVSKINSKDYSGELFGGISHCLLFEKILDTYQYDFYDDPCYPLCQRIKNIILACFPESEVDKLNENGIYIAGPYATYLPPNNNVSSKEYHFATHIYDDRTGEAGYITIFEANFAEFNTINSTQPLQNQTDQIKRLKSQLDEIYSSDSWKLIKRLKRLANSRFGLPFKVLFKKVLRDYRKIKYGIN